MSFAFGVAVGVAAAIIIKLSDPECRQRSGRSARETIEENNDQSNKTKANEAHQDNSGYFDCKVVEIVDEFQPRQYCILLKSDN